MGGKSSSAPPPDPRLVTGQLKSMGVQDQLIEQYMSLQNQLTPIQMEEMSKGIVRADKEFDYTSNRRGVLDARTDEQYNYGLGRQGLVDKRTDSEYDYATGRREVLDARTDEQYTYGRARQDKLDTRDQDQYNAGVERQARLDGRAETQFNATMDYNDRSLASQIRASDGQNEVARISANANAASAASNGRLADNAIKINDYQYGMMQERDKRWRDVGQKQEDALISKVDEMGSAKYRNQQVGMAVADVNQGFTDSRAQTMREMARRGIDGGGQFASMMARGNSEQALALAGTKNKTRMALNQADLGNRFNLNGALKGMAGMGDASAGIAVNALGAGRSQYMSPGGGGGFGGMGFGGGGSGFVYGGGGGGQLNVGGMGVNTGMAGGGFGYNGGGINVNTGAGLGYANQGAGGMLSGYQNGATMAGGMGQNAAGMYNAMGTYKNGQDNIQGEMWGSLLGAGAKLGAAAMMMPSDRRLKHGIVSAGIDAKTNLPLYVFSYRGDPEGRRYRGVMSDDVRKVAPEAVLEYSDGFDRVNYKALGLEMVEV
jgi:hypothetical protein